MNHERKGRNHGWIAGTLLFAGLGMVLAPTGTADPIEVGADPVRISETNTIVMPLNAALLGFSPRVALVTGSEILFENNDNQAHWPVGFPASRPEPLDGSAVPEIPQCFDAGRMAKNTANTISISGCIGQSIVYHCKIHDATMIAALLQKPPTPPAPPLPAVSSTLE